MEAARVRVLRILVVEDDPNRVRKFKSWIPDDVWLVWARNAGQALGILHRDAANTYAGAMLDFDLDKQLYAPEGTCRTGGDVARQIAQHFSPDVQILVHSMNPSERGQIVTVLAEQGFSVTQIPYRDLSKERLVAWLDEVRDNFEPED